MTTAGSRYLEGRPRLRHAGSYALYAVPGCRSALLAAIDAALMDLRILTWQERRKRRIQNCMLGESAETDPREVSLSIVRRGVVSTRPR